jgi:hypothetical protein
MTKAFLSVLLFLVLIQNLNGMPKLIKLYRPRINFLSRQAQNSTNNNKNSSRSSSAESILRLEEQPMAQNVSLTPPLPQPPLFNFESMGSFVHSAPQMTYSYLNNAEMFFVDFIPDVILLELDRSEMDLLEKLIKKSIGKFKGIDANNLFVKIYKSESSSMSQLVDPRIVRYQVLVNSLFTPSFSLSDQDFQKALIASSENDKKCSVNEVDGQVTCFPYVDKDLESILKFDKHWFKLVRMSMRQLRRFMMGAGGGGSGGSGDAAGDVSSLVDGLDVPPTSGKLTYMEGLAQVFKYQSTWIIGLSIIGSIIGVFFFGCIIAICYTRRPYKRSSKVYELDLAGNGGGVGGKSRGNKKRSNNTPNIPGIHPATRTSIQTKKELLYQ